MHFIFSPSQNNNLTIFIIMSSKLIELPSVYATLESDLSKNKSMYMDYIYDTIESKYKNNKLPNKEFAVTDLSHSRTIIEIEGNEAFEVIKKGSPLNLNNIEDGNCANSIYHGINVTIDFISSRPKKIRLYSLRSFGESFYESITDASLEFGYLVV